MDQRPSIDGSAGVLPRNFFLKFYVQFNFVHSGAFWL